MWKTWDSFPLQPLYSGNVADFIIPFASGQTLQSSTSGWSWHLPASPPCQKSRDVAARRFAWTHKKRSRQGATLSHPILFRQSTYAEHLPISECSQDVKSRKKAVCLKRKFRKEQMDLTAYIPQCLSESGLDVLVSMTGYVLILIKRG